MATSTFGRTACRTAFADERLSETLRRVEELQRLRKQTKTLAASGLFDSGAMKKSMESIDQKIMSALLRVDGLKACCATHK